MDRPLDPAAPTVCGTFRASATVGGSTCGNADRSDPHPQTPQRRSEPSPRPSRGTSRSDRFSAFCDSVPGTLNTSLVGPFNNTAATATATNTTPKPPRTTDDDETQPRRPCTAKPPSPTPPHLARGHPKKINTRTGPSFSLRFSLPAKSTDEQLQVSVHTTMSVSIAAASIISPRISGTNASTLKTGALRMTTWVCGLRLAGSGRHGTAGSDRSRSLAGADGRFPGAAVEQRPKSQRKDELMIRLQFSLLPH